MIGIRCFLFAVRGGRLNIYIEMSSKDPGGGYTQSGRFCLHNVLWQVQLLHFLLFSISLLPCGAKRSLLRE